MAVGANSSRRPRHLAAFVRTTLAFVGATLTVIHLVLPTLGSAGVTNVRAHPTDFLGKLRTATHEGGRRPADLGAVVVQPNALSHLGDILLAEACVAAMLALLRATDAGLHACLIFLIEVDPKTWTA